MPLIGVLCSGGDAPGMNAGIAEVVSQAEAKGYAVMGIREGLVGLAARSATPLNSHDCRLLARRGGCFLGSSRLPPGMRREELLDAALQGSRELDLSGLVVFGGNGSFAGLQQLASHIPCAGIPATIDNDLAGSVLSIGFDTARQHGLDALDALCDTGEALRGRVFTVEMLGGATGHLALAVAYAGFAHAILAPEVEEPGERIVDRVRGSLQRDGLALVVLSEGSPWVGTLTDLIGASLGVRVRPTVLGHLQRGGTPTAADRALARRLAAASVEMLHSGGSGAIVWDGVQCQIQDLALASSPRPLNMDLYHTVWAPSAVGEDLNCM